MLLCLPAKRGNLSLDRIRILNLLQLRLFQHFALGQPVFEVVNRFELFDQLCP
jgi:hypothetical protein